MGGTTKFMYVPSAKNDYAGQQIEAERLARAAQNFDDFLSSQPYTAAAGALGKPIAKQAAKEAADAAAKAASAAAAKKSLASLTTDFRQIESKFKHAADFGVTEARGKAGFAAFGSAVESFVNSPTTVRVEGTYRDNPAILNYDPTSALVVVQETSGAFVSGWKMSPGRWRT